MKHGWHEKKAPGGERGGGGGGGAPFANKMNLHNSSKLGWPHEKMGGGGCWDHGNQ